MTIINPIALSNNPLKHEMRKWMETITQRMSYQTYAGDPTGNATPRFVGDRCLDSTNSKWYHAVNTTNTGWIAMGGLDLSGMKLVSYPTGDGNHATDVSTDSDADTYAGYVEVVAASAITTAFYLVGVIVATSDGTARHTKIKVGAGAAGSEVVKAELSVHLVDYASIEKSIPIDPIEIDANARVAVDAQDDEAGGSNDVSITLLFKVDP